MKQDVNHFLRKYRREIKKEALILRDLNNELKTVEFRKTRHLANIVRLRNGLLKLENSNAQKVSNPIPVLA